MKRAHSSVKPTPIQMGDSISYYRLILRACCTFGFRWP